LFVSCPLAAYSGTGNRLEQPGSALKALSIHSMTTFLGKISGLALVGLAFVLPSFAHAQGMSTTTVETFFDGLTGQAWDLLLFAWGQMFPIIVLLAVVAMLIGLAISIVHLGRRKRR